MACILAVDDQRYFRELMEGFLRAEGHEAHTADGGARALERLGSGDFDVVVTDLVMPGMDGLQLMDAMGRRDDAPDVIVVSGVADVKVAVEVMQRGAADYLVKPFDREALARSVERVLQRRCMREDGARLAKRNPELEQALDGQRRALGQSASACDPSLFDALSRAELTRCRRHGGSFSLLRVEPRAEHAAASKSERRGVSWTSEVLERLARALRAGDRVIADEAGALRVLLPAADALAASLLKHRVREVLAERPRPSRQAADAVSRPPRFSIGSASFPADAEDLESLERAAARRAEEERDSPVCGLALGGASFAEALGVLLRGAGEQATGVPERLVHFLLDELRRRPLDRGLLVLCPAPDRLAAANAGLAALAETGVRAELVLLCENDPPAGEIGPIRRLARRRLGTRQAFAVYFGEGSAYASVWGGAPDPEPRTFFHTADRALVEYLALQLSRELSVPLAA